MGTIGKRLAQFFGILLLGMLCCVNGAPLILFYPIGRVAALFAVSGLTLPKSEILLLTVSYGLYALLLAGFLVVRRQALFSIFMTLMILTTLLNIAGCQIILHGLGRIGN